MKAATIYAVLCTIVIVLCCVPIAMDRSQSLERLIIQGDRSDSLSIAVISNARKVTLKRSWINGHLTDTSISLVSQFRSRFPSMFKANFIAAATYIICSLLMRLLLRSVKLCRQIALSVSALAGLYFFYLDWRSVFILCFITSLVPVVAIRLCGRYSSVFACSLLASSAVLLLQLELMSDQLHSGSYRFNWYRHFVPKPLPKGFLFQLGYVSAYNWFRVMDWTRFKLARRFEGSGELLGDLMDSFNYVCFTPLYFCGPLASAEEFYSFVCGSRVSSLAFDMRSFVQSMLGVLSLFLTVELLVTFSHSAIYLTSCAALLGSDSVLIWSIASTLFIFVLHHYLLWSFNRSFAHLFGYHNVPHNFTKIPVFYFSVSDASRNFHHTFHLWVRRNLFDPMRSAGYSTITCAATIGAFTIIFHGAQLSWSLFYAFTISLWLLERTFRPANVHALLAFRAVLVVLLTLSCLMHVTGVPCWIDLMARLMWTSPFFFISATFLLYGYGLAGKKTERMGAPLPFKKSD